MSRIAESNRVDELTATPVPPRRKRRWKLWLPLLVIVLPLLLLAGYTWLTLNFAYSNGERTGYLQKISRRGWVCKTWEGELAMMPVPGTVPQIFQFSVRDNAVAQQIQQAAGQQVSLSYQQHKGVPSTCFGETEYFVTGVRVLGK
jgi:hypothetical protein